MRPNARSKRNVRPRYKPSSLRLKAHGGNASWKLREKRAGTPAMLPANRGPSDGNHRPDIGINELGNATLVSPLSGFCVGERGGLSLAFTISSLTGSSTSPILTNCLTKAACYR